MGNSLSRRKTTPPVGGIHPPLRTVVTLRSSLQKALLFVAIGVLTRTFPPDLVDRVIDRTGRREQRLRLLPARVTVYFVLALCLFAGVPTGRRAVGGPGH